jgi:Lambda phage tail tube protein, TTP
MSGAVPGPGFLLQAGDGATPENYTTVAEVRDISGPEIKVDTHDVTNQSSPGGWAEFVPTIRRPGNVTFPVNYMPTNPTHVKMLTDCVSKTLRNWRVTENDGTTNHWSFAGYVTGFKQTAPVAGVLTADVEIAVTGQPIMSL